MQDRREENMNNMDAGKPNVKKEEIYERCSKEVMVANIKYRLENLISSDNEEAQYLLEQLNTIENNLENVTSMPDPDGKGAHSVSTAAGQKAWREILKGYDNVDIVMDASKPDVKESLTGSREEPVLKRTEFVSIHLTRMLEQISGMHTRSEWFENDLMKLYVRKTERNILGERVKTLEIVAIEVAEEFRRQGVFRRFIPRFEDIAYREGRIVYIQNVMPVFLQKHLEDYGFKRLEGDCFCKKR